MKLLYNGKIYADVLDDKEYSAMTIEDDGHGVVRVVELWPKDSKATYLDLQDG